MNERLDVSITEPSCIGSRLCNLAAPDVFAIDEERGVSEVLRSPVDGSEAVWDAIEGCPMEAIVATDADSGEQLFP